jgi:hypothetical protein
MWHQDYDFNNPASDQNVFDQSQVNAGTVYPLEQLADAAKSLHGFSPVTFIDLNLTASDRLALDQFEMTNITGRELYGNSLPGFPCSIHKLDLEALTINSTYTFLSQIAPEASPELINKIENLILNIVNKTAESLSAGLEYYSGSFTIETFMPSDEQVGWHTDNSCDHSNNDRFGPAFMFLATLKGDHTVYYTGDYNYGIDKCFPVHNENIPTELLVSYKQPYATTLGHAPIHIAHEVNGALHSWPNITYPRLLLRVSLSSNNCKEHYDQDC